MYMTVDNGRANTSPLPPVGATDRAVSGFFDKCSRPREPLQGANFVAIQQPRRILLHRHGCNSLSRLRAHEVFLMGFDSARLARDWLMGAKHRWQNCRACGGAKTLAGY